jgi:TonB family protein
VVLAVLFLLRFVWADSELDRQLNFDYADKVLTLRHFYRGGHLRFRSDGTLIGDAPVGPWTLDGQIEVQTVKMRRRVLLIKGRRIHRVFDSQLKPQDELTILSNSRDETAKDLEKTLRNTKTEIEIDLPSGKPDQKDAVSAIHAVFLTNSESMMEFVPSYWRAYFAKQEGRPQDAPIVKGPVYQPGEVSPPHADYRPDPEYSDEARKAKYQGVIVVRLIVDASGEPRDLQITRPLGLGLDEKAIEVIHTWKFKPALKDGEPVSVAVGVQVDFHLY